MEQQIELPLSGKLTHRDRTAEHEQGEAEVAAMGIPYPEQTRTLFFAFDGIAYQLVFSIMSWRVIPDNGTYPDELCCLRCGKYLQFVGPNMLHAVPLAMCDCSGALMEPLDERDRALLELQYPVSEADRELGSRFNCQLERLTKAPSGTENGKPN